MSNLGQRLVVQLVYRSLAGQGIAENLLIVIKPKLIVALAALPMPLISCPPLGEPVPSGSI